MRLHPEERVREYVAKGWWSTETIDGVFRRQVAARPADLAIVDPLNKEEDLLGLDSHRWTWAELDEQVDRLATVLLDHGVRRDDVVAVQLPNTVELVTSFLAVVRLGAIVTPFPVQYREHELTGLGRRAGVKAFVTAVRVGTRAYAEAARGLRAGVPTLGPVFAWGGEPPPGVVSLDAALAEPSDPAALAAYLSGLDVDPGDCVTICWTSGTGSTPKGVPRCHYDWLATAWPCLDTPRLTAADVLLNALPTVNVAGIAGMLLPWLRVGATLVQHHPFDFPTFLAQVAGQRVTYTAAPPAMLNLLLREDILAWADISSLRLVGSGGMPLTPAMIQGWQERYGVDVINFFGSSEGVALLSDPVNMPEAEDRARLFPRYGAAGVRWPSRIADWTSVRLVDPGTGEEITGPGRRGELRVKGPSVCAGHLDGSEAPGPFDDEGYLRTGDVFEIAGDRLEYLRYVDRARDVIIRGGVSIAPAEVEALLAGHPDVAESAVVGYPDDALGERCCVFVVARPGANVTLAKVVAFLRGRRIASYKLPERLEVVDALPRDPLGRVCKRGLRARLTTG